MEYCTPSENSQHCVDYGHKQKSRRPVEKLDINTRMVIKAYNSISEASKENNLHCTSVRNVCVGIQKTAGGFRWRYVCDE